MIPTIRPRRRGAARAAVGPGVVLALAVALAVPAPAGAAVDSPPRRAANAVGERPNIVVVMTDDMSMELLQYMPAVTEMVESGVTFENYIVSTPLCCPSRATFLAGQYPHVTGVLTNGARDGGFRHYAEERNSDLGYALQQGGYRTGLIGKYLNGYHPEGQGGSTGHPRGLVPRGWDEWAVGDAYTQWHYTLTESIDGRPPQGRNVFSHDGETEADYFTDFASEWATAFLDRAGDQPFALLVNPFASHKRFGPIDDPDDRYQPTFPPAPRDRKDSDTAPWPNEFRRGDCGIGPKGGCLSVDAPDPMWAESFDEVGTHPPTWRADLPELTQREKRVATVYTRQRAQSLQAVSDLIVALRVALGPEIDNTYLVFASDNGFFLGQHRLFDGKGTAYDHDVRVPLVIVPPGGLVTPRTVSEVVQNVDLAPTFAEIAGTPLVLPTDGRSILPFLEDSWSWSPETTWRDGGLISFLGDADRHGPDWSQTSDLIPSYHALRTEEYLYVDYTTLDDEGPAGSGNGEFYWLPTDPEQLDNRFVQLTTDQRRELNDALVEYAACAAESCRIADAELPVIDLPKR